jgi:isoleucyl-tRNA synthetase
VLSPVDEAGRFTPLGPDWLVGQQVFAANRPIIERLKQAEKLYHEQTLSHSYPHCWRCKKPVIFRATEQWFISVDHNDLRGRTLKAIGEVRWLPEWGRTRIEAMVSLRPDWCISRQRSWGVPIPALGCTSCQSQLLTAGTLRHFRDLFRMEGADVWFTWPVERLLPPEAVCPQCGGTSFRKEGDILDVWFESGSSHRAVLSQDFNLGYPAFMYLEGSDQHRGWFQSSILTAVGTNGTAPFETVLTHGFVVDDQGRKIAKSLGNYIPADEMTNKYGADVLRLYVASMDYADDISVSERGIKEMSDAYRKVRNTFRYLLGNLEDYRHFDPSGADLAGLHEIDRWMLGQLNKVVRDARAAYERFEFYRAHQRIYQFCAVELSSFYLDVLKDRLYADVAASPGRRAAQFVLARLHDHLTRLLAPIIPHTAEELWDYMPKAPEQPSSVHLAEFPKADPRWDDDQRDARWDELKTLREQVLVALEALRKRKEIGSAQEAKVQITTNRPGHWLPQRDLLATICIVSEVEVVSDPAASAESVTAVRSSYSKCERCWNHRSTVGESSVAPTLCERCLAAVADFHGSGADG